MKPNLNMMEETLRGIQRLVKTFPRILSRGRRMKEKLRRREYWKPRSRF
jgi:hypothetical protein